MEFKKNDLVTVKIEDMGHDGEGIGKAEGYTLFIKDTVIGDVVEAKIMKMKKRKITILDVKEAMDQFLEVSI